MKIGSVDVEAFSRNLARLIEEGGRALAAYLKPREEGRRRQRTCRGSRPKSSKRSAKSRNIGWPIRSARSKLQNRLGKAYLDLWAAAAKRLTGEETAPVVAPDAGDKRFADPEWSSNQFYDFLKQAYLLSARWANRLVSDAAGLDPHTRQKAEFYMRQITNAVSPSNFVLTNPELLRETVISNADNLVRGMRMLAEDIETGGGDLKIRQSDASMFEVGRNLADHARQGHFPERADAAHPIRAVDRDGAQAAAADRAALDQQILRARSDAGKILHQMVRRSGHHRVLHLLGQSRRPPRQEKLRGLRPRRAARRARRHQAGDRRGQGPHRRLLRRRHAARGHARGHGGVARRAHRVGDIVRRPGRFHPCRRSQGVRRRGAGRGARAAHGRARLSRRPGRWRPSSTCCARTI